MRVLVVTNMYPSPTSPAFGTFVADQVEAVRRRGVEVDVLLVDARKRKLAYLVGVVRLWRQLLLRRYDLIHAHHAMSGIVARMQIGLPVVVTYHGGEVGELVPGWLRRFARLGPHLFDRIIVVNRRERAILRDDPRVRVIPCGVNLDEFKPAPWDVSRRALGLPMDKRLVLWAGEYWQYEKRFELVKEAVAELRNSAPDAELVLLSGKPHAVVPAYMSACDLLVLASRSEGSPMVIKEAMACNLPIVSTDVGDVDEVIGGVEGCLLVEPKADEMAAAMLKVLRERRRTTGRDRIARLASGPTAERVVAVYAELARRARGSTSTSAVSGSAGAAHDRPGGAR